MKKAICLLIATLLLASVTGTVIAENEEYTYLAFLDFLPQGWHRDFTDKSIDASRAIHVEIIFNEVMVTAVLLSPDRIESQEDNSCVGARVTFDKPFDVIWGDNRVDYAVLEPKRVEIVGDVDYGIIVEIGDDYVILNSYYEHPAQVENNIGYTITIDTLQKWDNAPFQPGSGCRMIVDSEGTVLAMFEMYG